MQVRRRLIGLLVAASVASLVAGAARVAGAVERSGPPDAGGFSAVCGVNQTVVDDPTFPSTLWRVEYWFRCNYGLRSGAHPSNVYFVTEAGEPHRGESGMPASNPVAEITVDSTARRVQGWLRVQQSKAAGGTTLAAMRFFYTTTGQVAVDYGTVGTAAEHPAYPEDYYSGGTPGAVSDVEAAVYACGRTMRDVGSGQWFADLEAYGPLNPPESEWSVSDHATDFNGWSTSWGGDVFGEQIIDNSNGSGSNYSYKATVPLPALSSRPAGGWTATFTSKREAIGSGHQGDAPPAGFERKDIDHDDDALTAPQKWFVSTLAPGVQEWWAEQLRASNEYRERLSNPTAYDLARWRLGPAFRLLDVGGGDWASGGAGWDAYVGRCTVLVDPAAPDDGAIAAGPAGEAGQPGTPGTDGEDGQDGDPGTGGDDDCANRSLWGVLNPLNIGRTLGCILRALFIPSDPLDVNELWDELRGEFPFTILDDLQGAAMSMVDEAILGIDEAGACLAVDVGAVVPEPAAGRAVEFVLRPPTPSDSGCAGMNGAARTDLDDQAGDLWGFRVWLRTLALVFVLVTVFRRVVAVFSPAKESADGLVPG